MANSEDPDQTAPLDLSVQEQWIIAVIEFFLEICDRFILSSTAKATLFFALIF